MKKFLALSLALLMVLSLAACGPANGDATPTPTQASDPTPTEKPDPTPTEAPDPTPTEKPTPEPTEAPTPTPTEEVKPSDEPKPSDTPKPSDEPKPTPTEKPTPTPTEKPTPTPTAKPTDPPASSVTAASTVIDFGSDVKALEGNWKLVQVQTASGAFAAQKNAMSLEVKLDVDPYELVDDAAYIHNQLYNLTAYLSFGLDDIKKELSGDDVESYKGTAGWESFTMGKVMPDGEWYQQPGPASIRFKDIDSYGLFLDKVAGVTDDIDTTEKKLIIGMNSAGQLLVGFSEEHLERPDTKGEWVYCLVFEK